MAPIQNPTVVEMVDLINKTLSSPRLTERRLLALWVYLHVIVNTPVSDDDSVCLYALRSSLAHHFSLVNIPPPRTGVARAKKLTRLFTLTRGAGILLQRPGKPWNPKRPNRGEPTVIEEGPTGVAQMLRLCPSTCPKPLRNKRGNSIRRSPVLGSLVTRPRRPMRSMTRLIRLAIVPGVDSGQESGTEVHDRCNF
jgi:hypothetical protein